jgi:membrane protease YdiL (CAAX protease family)
MNLRVRRALEFFLLFIGVPTLVAFNIPPIHPFLVMYIVAAGALLVLWWDRSFDRRWLWNAREFRKEWRRMLVLFVIAAPFLLLYVWIALPDRLFAFPREHTLIWFIVCLVYPVVSVYPQEVLYRPFLFHRYSMLFETRWRRIVVSALVFSYLHIVFWSPIALVLTLLGGFVFAWTYDRSRSTFAVSVEHTIYGIYVFTIGYGWYFYTGSVR